MSAPSGTTVYTVVSGASSATQATAEGNFTTALAAITPKAGTFITNLGFQYVVSGTAAAPWYTVAALIQYIQP